MSRARTHGQHALAAGCLAATLLAAHSAGAQAPVPVTVERLVRMSRPELEVLYRASPPGPPPAGRVYGTVLRPDSPLGPAVSRAGKLVWQGKVFNPANGTATNKFFGVNVVKGQVGYGPSWLDGGQSLILDYHETSLVYRPYRDEIRQVAPGLYLGLMYDRTTPCPTLKMLFAFQTCR